MLPCLSFSSYQSSGANGKISPLTSAENWAGGGARLHWGVGVGRKLACGLAPWGTECHTKPVIVNPECGRGLHPLSSCPGGGCVGYQNYLRGFSCDDTVSECVSPNPLPRTIFTD